MLLSTLPSNERTAGTTSSRTQCTIASAKLQRMVAGGVTATRVLSASTTASSRTTSSTPHSPAPVSGGSDGAIAQSVVKRSRKAEGGAGASACVGWVVSGSDAAGASTGRGRGNGTLRARATSQATARIIRAKASFTAVISLWIA